MEIGDEPPHHGHDVPYAHVVGARTQLPAPARAALGCGAAAVLLLLCSLTSVPAAHVGVVVKFGAVAPQTLTSGLHVVAPWASVETMPVKTQMLYSENLVPTSEGLNVELDVALLYKIDETMVRKLYLELGPEFEAVLVQPELSSALRGLTSEKSAKALYTSGRSQLRNLLQEELTGKLAPRGIILEDVLLKGIKLPAQLTASIELKAQAEQESARMEFVLTKEKQEAERKRIEAQGIADFQKIVSTGISPELLQWKGIEATERLAQSNNAKMVIMGNGKDSLPVLLSAAGE
ncbi:membrane protease subunit [Pelagophyceae sp. CCMP2097]|nr:membrane protease subunit [Pelagophyceae sp. CCMP2097]